MVQVDLDEKGKLFSTHMDHCFALLLVFEALLDVTEWQWCFNVLSHWPEPVVPRYIYISMLCNGLYIFHIHANRMSLCRC